jgi:predicted kinase
MRRLKVTVGLPRSGKTTWARQQGAPIVNPDSIRLALHGQRFVALAEAFVWAVAHVMVGALFLAGCEVVVVDATNVSTRRRAEWEGAAARWGAAVDWHVVDTSPQECRERALAEGDLDILPVIDRMEREWDLERPAEWGGGR